MNYAPIGLFVYNRPWHTRQTVDALLANAGAAKTPLHIFSDAPKGVAPRQAVSEVRSYIRTIGGFGSVTIIERKTNFGLARSIIDGVTQLCEEYGRVIVMEDDLVTSPSFLEYMNAALDRYANDEKVFQVSGYMFDVPELRGASSALFLPFPTSWGWATWKRAWDRFDPLASGWEALRTDKDLRRRFNLDGTYDYATMLVRQMAGLLDSWAVRWCWTVFKAKGLVLFPPVSLVSNTGFDGSGSHGRGWLRRFSKIRTVLPPPEIDLPESIILDAGLYAHVKKALWRQNGGFIAPVVDRIRCLLKH